MDSSNNNDRKLGPAAALSVLTVYFTYNISELRPERIKNITKLAGDACAFVMKSLFPEPGYISVAFYLFGSSIQEDSSRQLEIFKYCEGNCTPLWLSYSGLFWKQRFSPRQERQNLNFKELATPRKCRLCTRLRSAWLSII